MGGGLHPAHMCRDRAPGCTAEPRSDAVESHRPPDVRRRAGRGARQNANHPRHTSPGNASQRSSLVVGTSCLLATTKKLVAPANISVVSTMENG